MIFTIEWTQSDKNVREIFWAIHVMIFTFYFGWAGLNISNIIQPFMIIKTLDLNKKRDLNRVHSFKSWQLIFSSSLLLSYLWHRHEIQSNYTEYTPLIISHDSWHYLLRNLLKYNYTQKHLVLSFHSIYFITGQSGAYLSNYTLTLEKDALTGRPDWGKFRYSFIHIYKYLEKSKKSFLNLSEYLTLNQ